MSEHHDPWSKPAGPDQPPGRHRFLLWIALLLAGAIGLIQLSRCFPGAISSQDEPYLVRAIVLLAVVSASIVFTRRFKLSEVAKNTAIWCVVVAVLAVGYAYREDLRSIGTRVQSEFLPGDPVATGDPHVLTLRQDTGGDFYVYASVGGTRIRFVVDTGASDIVLSPSDAKRLGVDLDTLHYVSGFETANGIGAGAPYTLPDLAVGPIQMWNIPVSINRTDMHASLLGMAFLKRLKSFEFADRKLTLRW